MARRGAAMATAGMPEVEQCRSNCRIAALAKQYKDVLSEQPGAGEKHREVWFAGCEPNHRVRRLAFLVTFWAMPKSNRLAAGET